MHTSRLKHHDTGGNGFPPPPAAASPRVDSRNLAYAFSAADLEHYGLRRSLNLNLLMVGLGTTGSRVVNRVVRLQQAVFGLASLPDAFQYLLVDAALPQPGMDPEHFHLIPGGVDGAGTDPRRGRELFGTERNYAQLRTALNAFVVDLLRAGAGSSGVSAREAMDAVVVGGPGGTSGGILHPAITLLHDVARDRNLQDLRVHAVQLGPEIALRDRQRQVAPEQRSFVRATAASNLARILTGLARDGWTEERRPDGTIFHVEAGRRVWSVTVLDQGNGHAECSTTDEFVDLAAHTLLLRYFTLAGKELADRYRDLDQTGVHGRGRA